MQDGEKLVSASQLMRPWGWWGATEGRSASSDIITFVIFLFFSLLKGLLTAGLWQLKTSEKSLSEVKCTGHFDSCAPLMLQLFGEVTCVTATRMAGEWSLQTLFQGEERGSNMSEPPSTCPRPED